MDPKMLAMIQAMPEGPLKAQALRYAHMMGAQTAAPQGGGFGTAGASATPESFMEAGAQVAGDVLSVAPAIGDAVMNQGNAAIGGAAPQPTMQPVIGQGGKVIMMQKAPAQVVNPPPQMPVQPQAPNPQVAWGFAPDQKSTPFPVTQAEVDKLAKEGAISKDTAAKYKAKIAQGQPVDAGPSGKPYVPTLDETASSKPQDASSGKPMAFLQGSSTTPLFGAAQPAKPLGAARTTTPQSPAQPEPPQGSWLDALSAAFRGS